MHYEVLVYGYDSFNTQPPEGGWLDFVGRRDIVRGFNTQPPEGGWLSGTVLWLTEPVVSTHSRLKAAGRYTSSQC